MKETKLKRIWEGRRGSSVVLFTVMFTIIIGFTALTVDVGSVVLEKSRLSSAVDAAALAGVQELVANSANTQTMVRNYLDKNIQGLDQSTIAVNSSEHWVKVTAVKQVDYFFAGILGLSSQNITAEARAKAENISSLAGTRPLAVIHQTFNYGTRYTLKEGAGDGNSGNYAAISLGGNGGSVYRDNLLYGYPGVIKVGDIIPTETGNISGTTQTCINHLVNSCSHSPQCTYQYYNKNCSRIILIPVVNTLDVNGKKNIKVLGFATFFLEGTVNQGGHTDVVGRFITYSANGETSSTINDYGTYGIKLVN